MDFNDRRPGKGQLDIFGGEHPGEPGLTPQDAAGSRRLAVRGAAHARVHSDVMRSEDEEMRSIQIDRGKGHYGLPRAGLVAVSDFGIQTRAAPQWATYHGNSPSARLKHSQVREVPIQSAEGPSIRVHQPVVSSQRLNQQIEHPETTSNPRLSHQELPYAYHDPFLDEHTVIDGTHRVVKAVAQNQMFQPMRVFSDKEGPAIRAHTKRMDYLRDQAYQKTGVDPHEVISQRLFGGGS